MPKHKTALSGNQANVQAQAYIYEKFGRPRVEAQQADLCARCTNGIQSPDYRGFSCKLALLPITTAGKQCPYFRGKPV